MKQIIINYLGVFIVPALIGFVVRFLLRRSRKGYWVTAGLAVLTVVGWIAYNTIPSHGSELYGILAAMITSALAGSFVTGLVIRLKVNR